MKLPMNLDLWGELDWDRWVKLGPPGFTEHWLRAILKPANEGDVALAGLRLKAMCERLSRAEQTLERVRAFADKYMEKEDPGEMSPWAGDEILKMIDGKGQGEGAA